MVSVFRVEAKITSKRELHLSELPFKAGDEVEVFLRRRGSGIERGRDYPLRGTPIRYIGPFDAVAEEDWLASLP